MFQTFKATTTPDTGAPRLAALRALLRERGLDGFLVPRADAHQGEYVIGRDQRLAWLTGFTGSAGFCIALAEVAGVFIDGRYRLQVRDQVDQTAFTPVNWPETKPGDWLQEQLSAGGVVGYDPWLHTKDEIETLEKSLGNSGISLRQCTNLVDEIWQDQPGPPSDLMVPYPTELAGKGHSQKQLELGETLSKKGHNAAVLTQLDSIAWLLNTRGTDLGQTPVALAFAIAMADGTVRLFLDAAKMDANLREHLGNSVEASSTDQFGPALDTLEGVVAVDPKTAPIWVGNRLSAAGVETADSPDPTALPKACKNAAEIAGTTEAHLRDGAAVAEFLAWLDAQGSTPGLSEIDVVKRLETFRNATGELRNISFDTICGSGPNGAIVHYRVTEDTNRQIESGDVLLVDSGAQYLDGTTDITRTMAIGTPAPEAVYAFTLVLKGMIAISRQRFPKGLTGRDLDPLARAALWRAGLDFNHGTGHGVGVYLSVHEGPQRLSRLSDVPLRAGMILSNEPGYYREGAFGIRLENLIIVESAPDIAGADNREMLQFRTLTWAPLDRRMIDITLLSTGEQDWLNNYHDQVVEKISPRCTPETQNWLVQACAPM
ncbi:MAG: aminopeptidase P family protein [Rhodobacteraceae bacterium]|nr:aminopeptidase P family protein [Paracoccaceae bacterium]